MNCPEQLPSYAEYQALKNELEALKARVAKIESELSQGLTVDVTNAIKTALNLWGK